MREAKYRYWDGKQMIYQSKTHSFNIGGPHGNEMLTWLGFNMISNEPIDNLMQFTGLTDKNGVEIYEGDILTAHQFLFDGNEVESQIFGEIKSGEFGWLLSRIKNDFYEDYTGYEPHEGESYLLDFYGLHEESFEIIGNTHQSPELLESKQ